MNLSMSTSLGAVRPADLDYSAVHEDREAALGVLEQSTRRRVGQTASVQSRAEHMFFSTRGGRSLMSIGTP